MDILSEFTLLVLLNAANSWYGIVIPFTLDPVTNHSFALLTKYEMFETGTRHSAIFSIYNLRILGRHNVRHVDLLTFAVASL